MYVKVKARNGSIFLHEVPPALKGGTNGLSLDAMDGYFTRCLVRIEWCDQHLVCTRIIAAPGLTQLPIPLPTLKQEPGNNSNSDDW